MVAMLMLTAVSAFSYSQGYSELCRSFGGANIDNAQLMSMTLTTGDEFGALEVENIGIVKVLMTEPEFKWVVNALQSNRYLDMCVDDHNEVISINMINKDSN